MNDMCKKKNKTKNQNLEEKKACIKNLNTCNLKVEHLSIRKHRVAVNV